MIQYLLIVNDDETITVVKVVGSKQVSSYRIMLNATQMDLLLETFVQQIPLSHGMKIAYGEEEK